MICNHDCFECPYPDCVVDEVTPEEIEDSNIREARLSGNLRDAQKRAYRAWYWRHREEINRERRERYAQDQEYRESRRESVRKNYAKKKAQKQAVWIINPAPVKLEYKYGLDYIRAHREKRANEDTH